MISRTLTATLLAGLAIATPVSAQENQNCPTEGAMSPLSLHEEWIMEGWERSEGDPAFDFVQKMGKYYDLDNPEGVFFDNFAPGDTQLFTDASIYGPNWEDLQNQAKSILHGMTEGHGVMVSGDVASTAVGFVGRIEPLEGEVSAFDARSQLGWGCVGGVWKIKHEVNYAWDVDPQDIEGILGQRIEQ
jgi:hypothetical protein